MLTPTAKINRNDINIELGDCHIGEFDVDMCNQVQGVCASYWMAK